MPVVSRHCTQYNQVNGNGPRTTDHGLRTYPMSEPNGFGQRIGLFDATMLVAGSMIGSGIFIVSCFIAQDVGSSGWLIVVWLLTGFLTIVGALAYAELASMMPHAGGQYVFLREAYGPLSAFLYGWTLFLVIQTGFIAAVSVAFAKFLGVFVPALGTTHKLLELSQSRLIVELPVPWMDEPMKLIDRDGFAITSGQLVAVVLAIVLTAINSLGVREGRLVQNVFTVSKMLGLGLLIVLGLTIAANPDAIAQNTTHIWDGITTTKSFEQVYKLTPWTPLAVLLVLSGAMVGALFSADAWNNVTFIAGEVKNPQRTLPWSLLLGTGLVIVLYVLANFAYLAALPMKGQENVDPTAENASLLRGIDHAKDDRVGTAVLERVSPRFGVMMMAAIIMISTFGCVNGLTMMGPRLYYAMAKDGLFFSAVGRLTNGGVPVAGLWLQCIWSIVLIFSGSYNELLDYIVFAALLFYVLTVSAVFVLRKRLPDVPRPYKAWGYPALPALYIILCTVIMLSLLIVKPVYSWPSFIIVLAGIPVYYLWRSASRR